MLNQIIPPPLRLPTDDRVTTRIKDDEFDLNSANTFYTTTIDDFIKRHITHNGAYTAGAVAAVVPGRRADLAAADEQKRHNHICARYRPHQILLTIADTKPAAHTE